MRSVHRKPTSKCTAKPQGTFACRHSRPLVGHAQACDGTAAELTNRAVVQLAAYLHGRGISAMAYHAGLSAGARQDVSDSLASGRVSVVTCTTALSTGLDCSRVDGVLHYSLPPSMEEYVQQVCHLVRVRERVAGFACRTHTSASLQL